jgi:proton-dependent oligopeptide transporter, POT family
MFKHHPPGLRVLFFTEMWERFGFYILMAVFVLYMDQEFAWADQRKADLYGIFLGAVYFLPILGGWLGDRILGHRNTIRVGAVLMVLGYLALAVSGLERLWAFYAGLVLVSTGTGIFKANMSVTVGALYDANPLLKDAGFNIYYMGVNLGAAIAPLAATLVHNVFGSYRISFAAASVGMAVAILTFELGKKRLPETNHAVAAAGAGGTEIRGMSRAEERQRLGALAILFLIVIFFWVAFYQNGFALTLFAQRATRASDLLKPETYQFFNPFFILLLTPAAVTWFGRLRGRRKEPPSALKIFLGMFISGFAMLVMVAASLAGGNLDQNIMSPLWLVGSYFIVTLAEILVSPMGQSYVTKVAPARMKGLMIGCWFGATAVGGYGSGLLGRFYGDVPHHQYYLMIAALLFLSSLLILLALKKLNRFAP